MINFLLVLLGLISSNNKETASEMPQNSSVVISKTSETIDTGGETGTTLPPKK
ncbi:hypothetical protein [Chryseobacterium vrystaatense]|uniref:Uncharacterized protein n=1 Tax=Chryseobacterium vrystaatense TaxID=307480 RepID=A0A1M4TWN6_9FLAO|nr:hypothetical protein [Chryseobacterium vrystaatense]SHE48860.1 hypothetical protein SAMN02787073_0469 [Chryseobacterium vrystaatense]